MVKPSSANVVQPCSHARAATRVPPCFLPPHASLLASSRHTRPSLLPLAHSRPPFPQTVRTCAMAVLPVPGLPASRMARPAILPSLIISRTTPAARRACSWPTMPCDCFLGSSASSRPRPRMCECAPTRGVLESVGDNGGPGSGQKGREGGGRVERHRHEGERR